MPKVCCMMDEKKKCKEYKSVGAAKKAAARCRESGGKARTYMIKPPSEYKA